MERESEATADVVRPPVVPGQRPDTDRPEAERDESSAPHVAGPWVPAQTRSGSLAGANALGPRDGTPSDEVTEALARARIALGFVGRPALVACRVDVRIELDRHGAVRTLTRRTAWEATRNGAESFPVVALVSPPARGRAEVEALRGCVAGPEYLDVASGVLVKSLQLREPLSVGQVAEAVHRVRWPVVSSHGRVPQRSWEFVVQGAKDDVRIEVVFHPSRVARMGAVLGRTGGREWSAAVSPVDGSLVWTGAVDGPGVVALRWDW